MIKAAIITATALAVIFGAADYIVYQDYAGPFRRIAGLACSVIIFLFVFFGITLAVYVKILGGSI